MLSVKQLNYGTVNVKHPGDLLLYMVHTTRKSLKIMMNPMMIPLIHEQNAVTD